MPTRWRWPPRELVRVAARERRRQADALEQLAHSSARARRGRAPAEPSATMLPTDMRGSSDENGILEDDLHAAAQLAQRAPVGRVDVDAVDPDRAARERQQPQREPRQRRLAASRTRRRGRASRRGAIVSETSSTAERWLVARRGRCAS